MYDLSVLQKRVVNVGSKELTFFCRATKPSGKLLRNFYDSRTELKYEQFLKSLERSFAEFKPYLENFIKGKVV